MKRHLIIAALCLCTTLSWAARGAVVKPSTGGGGTGSGDMTKAVDGAAIAASTAAIQAQLSAVQASTGTASALTDGLAYGVSHSTITAAQIVAGGSGGIAPLTAGQAIPIQSSVTVSGTVSATGQVSSNRMKLEEKISLDWTCGLFGSTSTVGTNGLRCSQFFSDSVDISTITVAIVGYSGGTGNIYMVTKANWLAGSLTGGTSVYTTVLTVSTSAFISTTLNATNIPAGSALVYVPATWGGTGVIKDLDITGYALKH